MEGKWFHIQSLDGTGNAERGSLIGLVIGFGFLLLPDTLQPSVKWSGRREGLKGAQDNFWRWYVHSLDCSDCSPYAETY